MLHIGLKSYKDFPFLRTQVLAIKDGCYISEMTLEEVKSIADACDMEIGEYYECDEETPVIFFHHFR